MNWGAIGAIGELLGGVLVLGTLGYLAIQIRQSARVARSSVRQSIADSISANARSVSENDDLARMLQKEFDGAGLEPHEKTRLEARCYAAFRLWENVYHQYKDGLVTESEWKAYRENLYRLLGNKVHREFWKQFESVYSEEFRTVVNQYFDSKEA